MLLDLAFDAAERLLESLEWKREEVDALIVVTQSPDYLAPATAIILRGPPGAAHSTVAFRRQPGLLGLSVRPQPAGFADCRRRE
ncbi:hypothetical protein P4234_26780 [Pseudomonas aeruginosa]|nr:hypothetical protein [Pseudomonas aeruginosa]